MIRRTPSGASEMSLMSKRRVAAIPPPVECRSLRGQEPLVLALFPVDPRAGVGCGREPAVDGAPELRLPPQSGGERKLVDPEPKDSPELCERTQLVELAEPVGAVARRRPRGNDEPVPLEVAQHARRPAAPIRRLADRECRHPAPNLNTSVARPSPLPDPGPHPVEGRTHRPPRGVRVPLGTLAGKP